MFSKNYCLNCKTYGHISKYCSKPIESCGLIILQVSDDIKNIILQDKICFNEEINNFNYKRISNLKNIEKYKDKIKFLLVEKNNSLNYIEFIRGLYDVNDTNKLRKIFSLMSNDEINKIKTRDFNFLWNNLWKKTAKKKIYYKEFLNSYKKFNCLLSSGKLNELLLIKSKFNSPEWEIPKGKRKFNETNIDCAIREIKEETSLEYNKYIILKNLLNGNTINYEYYGTNNIKYKNIFYLAVLNDKNITLNINVNKEIKQCNFLTLDNLTKFIRSYDTSKIQLLYKIFLFIMNLCEENINNNSYLNA